MKRAHGSRWFRRIIASIVLIAYSAGCTHMPSGEKAFDSFESCFAANLGLAAVGGVAIGALSTHLTKQLTGSSSAATAVGTTAGIAAAAMIGLTAWRKCAAVYNKSEVIVQKGEHAPPPPAPGQSHKPGLNLARLDVRVEGTENDPPVPEFNFSFYAENPAAKDVKAKFRHKVEIVRFMAGENDKLILANAKGEPLLDASGKPIPLDAATKMPRDRLQWVTIADEGRDDYVEDVIIQQGQRTNYRHKLQIPPRAKLPLPLPVPMRYTLTVEADNMKSSRTVDFALLGTGERPKRFSSSAAKSSDAGAAPATSAAKPKEEQAAPAAEIAATHTVKNNITLYGDVKPPRVTVASLKKGARVRVAEHIPVTTNNKVADWVRVIPETGGTGGWTLSGNLALIK